MEIIKNIEQGSPEWFELRRGLVTSSCFSKVMSKGQGKTRASYMLDLAFERLSGKSAPDDYKSVWMERGNEIEDQARAAYEMTTGNDVEQIAFIKLNEDVGSSTDGLISDGLGLQEIKCPKHSTHINYLLNPDKLVSEYKKQVQGGLWVSGLRYVDLVSFHPDFPPGKDILIQNVERDNDFIADIKTEVEVFVVELKQLVDKIRGE